MKPLTDKQQKIADYIRKTLHKEKRSPTFREIAKAFSIRSLSTVHFHIKALEKKGYLLSEKHQPRALTLQESFRQSEMKLPLIGNISAFRSFERAVKEELVSIPSELVESPESTSLLRIEDQSFLEEGILRGDLLVIEERTPEEGEVAFLSAGGISFLRKYREEKDQVILTSQNEALSEMVLPKLATQLHGTLISLLRLYF